MSRSEYARQFKEGTYPLQHWDESTRTNTHEQDPPSEMRKRNSVARGSQTEANPGMVGKADYSRGRRK